MVSSSYLKETWKQPEKLTAYENKVIIYSINSCGCFRMQFNFWCARAPFTNQQGNSKTMVKLKGLCTPTLFEMIACQSWTTGRRHFEYGWVERLVSYLPPPQHLTKPWFSGKEMKFSDAPTIASSLST